MASFIDNLIGDKLGRYRLEKLLGKGGYGAVYQSTQQELKRPVAIKVLLPSLAWGDPSILSYIDRFHSEGQRAASLHHTNIIPIYELNSQVIQALGDYKIPGC